MIRYKLERFVARHDGGVDEVCDLAVCRKAVDLNFSVEPLGYGLIALENRVVDDLAVRLLRIDVGFTLVISENCEHCALEIFVGQFVVDRLAGVKLGGGFGLDAFAFVGLRGLLGSVSRAAARNRSGEHRS